MRSPVSLFAASLNSVAMGPGRMIEPDEVVSMARVVLARNGDLAGQRVVITAGGTREAIDPVRFVSNHSSGKMGYALAEVARDRGALVTLITTVDRPDPLGIEVVRVDSAEQMLAAVLTTTREADILVMAAAVADFRPQTIAERKIKKKADTEGLTLEMVPEEYASSPGRTVRNLVLEATWLLPVLRRALQQRVPGSGLLHGRTGVAVLAESSWRP